MGRAGKPVWTAEEIAGLGKNYMTEASRVAGIKAYTSVIRSFALKGLLRVLQHSHITVALHATAESLPALPQSHPDYARCVHTRMV